MSIQSTRAANPARLQSEIEAEARGQLQDDIEEGLRADRASESWTDEGGHMNEAPESIHLPEPRALSLQEAAEAVGVRRDKVPVGYDGHLEAQKDGDFDRLAQSARSNENLSADDQARLVSFGLRDRLITPGELSAEALEKAWALTSVAGTANRHPPEDEA